MRKHILVWSLLGSMVLLCHPMKAQEREIREADHFWRKRVVNRISLIEKFNKPLVAHSASFYGDGNGKYSETDGIVVSLISGVKAGKYVAYHPDSWDKTLEYPDLRARMREFEGQLINESDNDWETDDYMASDDFTVDEDPFIDADTVFANDWPFEEVNPAVDNAETASYDDSEIDYYPYEQVLHVVEDWIFDKGQSEMVQRIDFFEIIWVDPSGVLPESVLARFKWKEVKPQLEQTSCQNRFNDAEARSMKEVMALRMFNSLVIHVGNQPVRTLHEAIRRKQELIEFEHHLWSY